MILNTVWIDPPLPKLQQMCFRSWIAHGHTVHCWTYEPFGLPAGVVRFDAAQILPPPIRRYTDANHAGSPVLHANLFRYELLAQRGGTFADADTLCLQPFELADTLAFSSEGTIGTLPGSRHPNLALVHCPAEWRGLFRYAAERAAKRLGGATWGRFGPALLRMAIEEFQQQPAVLPPAAFCPIGWDRAQDIFDESPPDLSGSLGIHLWQQMLSDKGSDLNRRYPAESLWSEWERLYG